ncbi:hypothetical protein [Bacillus sp. UNC438CL73TsuS30]|uniref:hypothetical protein n=1 Tax=Bacillus sp. UNC438CL73TsuS30 TaxID=1340434 RepID=UPI00047C5881|nr:hypothetical protein [Bacillus sp. UNC438CL73TsuS30]
MSSDIVVVGSLNMDMVVKINRKPEWGETLLGSDLFMSPGGKGGNRAYAAGKTMGTVLAAFLDHENRPRGYLDSFVN